MIRRGQGGKRVYKGGKNIKKTIWVRMGFDVWKNESERSTIMVSTEETQGVFGICSPQAYSSKQRIAITRDTHSLDCR